MTTIQHRNQPLLLIIFIVTPGFSIVLSCLVFLVKDFGGNAVIFGILSAKYSAFQLRAYPKSRPFLIAYKNLAVSLVRTQMNQRERISGVAGVFTRYLPHQPAGYLVKHLPRLPLSV
jgi:hypothetical protein